MPRLSFQQRVACSLKRFLTPVLPFERLHCVPKDFGSICFLEFYHPNRGMVAHINYQIDASAMVIMSVHVHGGPSDAATEYMRTLPNYRGRGIGNRLLSLAFDKAREQGLRVVRINAVHPFATQTIDVNKWYRRHGFTHGPSGQLEATVAP